MAELYGWNDVRAAALPCSPLCHLTPLALVLPGGGVGPAACAGLPGGHVWWGASACPPVNVAASCSELTLGSGSGQRCSHSPHEEPMFALQECPKGQPGLLESLFPSLTQSSQQRHIVPLAARIWWRSCWSRCPCLAVPGMAGQPHCSLVCTSRGGSCWSSF